MTEQITNEHVPPFLQGTESLVGTISKDAGYRPESAKIVEKNLENSNSKFGAKRLKISKVLKGD